MEGLIPMVYRAIKRSKERSHYEYLSSSTTARNYDISEFYPLCNQTQAHSHFYLTPPPQGTVNKVPIAGRGIRHSRSYSSAAEFSFEKRFHPEDSREMPIPRKPRLVRFRSTRMLSCLTGA